MNHSLRKSSRHKETKETNSKPKAAPTLESSSDEGDICNSHSESSDFSCDEGRNFIDVKGKLNKLYSEKNGLMS